MVAVRPGSARAHHAAHMLVQVAADPAQLQGSTWTERVHDRLHGRPGQLQQSQRLLIWLRWCLCHGSGPAKLAEQARLVSQPASCALLMPRSCARLVGNSRNSLQH